MVSNASLDRNQNPEAGFLQKMLKTFNKTTHRRQLSGMWKWPSLSLIPTQWKSWESFEALQAFQTTINTLTGAGWQTAKGKVQLKRVITILSGIQSQGLSANTSAQEQRRETNAIMKDTHRKKTRFFGETWWKVKYFFLNSDLVIIRPCQDLTRLYI